MFHVIYYNEFGNELQQVFHRCVPTHHFSSLATNANEKIMVIFIIVDHRLSEIWCVYPDGNQPGQVMHSTIHFIGEPTMNIEMDCEKMYIYGRWDSNLRSQPNDYFVSKVSSGNFSDVQPR